MEHKNFYEMYNEVMFDERDLIEKFLNEQSSLIWGNQMYEWEISPAIDLVKSNGERIKVNSIRRDHEKFVVFHSYDAHETLECTDFAYGELSKILDILPDPIEVKVKGYVKSDFYKWTSECAVGLDGNLFHWDNFYVHNIFQGKRDDGTIGVMYEINEGETSEGWGLWEELDPEVALQLHAHVKKDILRRSQQYKTLTKQLNWFGGNLYNFSEHGEVGKVWLTPDGTDLDLMVLDVSMESGSLEVLVSIMDTAIGNDTGEDTMTLFEKDLTPKMLNDLIKFFDKETIMDTSNGHDKLLVEIINNAWNDKGRMELFKYIIFSLILRDKEESFDKIGWIPDDYTSVGKNEIHAYLQEVADDTDLETILQFVRHE